MACYYDGLSGESSDDNESDSDSHESCDLAMDPTFSPDMRRFNIHADIDCFYCQCEILERGLEAERPFAIGQKHIVVTSNYAARKFGVTKLVSRDVAYQRCPHLVIFEGSDLERYRIHGRKVYESFRKACKTVWPDADVKKGSMDEMMAEIPHTMLPKGSETGRSSEIFVFGKERNETFVLTEDQSGDTCLCGVEPTHVDDVTILDIEIHQELLQVARLSLGIRQAILKETGFTTTFGVSVNPLLAKVASGLRKPDKVNVLPPGIHCRKLIASMPLRKIPGVGRQTMKALIPCLMERHGTKRDNDNSPWTCQDLTQVPSPSVVKALERSKSQGISGDAAEFSSTLLRLCQGEDKSHIQDDCGGIQKSLSVENSFRRGTIRTRESVMSAMNDLYRRLPRLLKQRTEWSTNKSQAFPRTICLTARKVVQQKSETSSRRPFTTYSQQTSFEGRSFLAKDESGQIELLRGSASPMLQSMIFVPGSNVDITRLNLSLRNFQDIVLSPERPIGKHPFSKMQSSNRPQSKHEFSNAKKTQDGYSSVLAPEYLRQHPSSRIDPGGNVIQRKKRRIDQFFVPKS